MCLNVGKAGEFLQINLGSSLQRACDHAVGRRNLFRGVYKPVGEGKVVRRRGHETKTRCRSRAVDGQNGAARSIQKGVGAVVDEGAAAVSPIEVILRFGYPGIRRAQSVFPMTLRPPARSKSFIIGSVGAIHAVSVLVDLIHP